MSYYLPAIIVLSLLVLISAFFIVKQQTAAIIETFGKFTSIRHAGFNPIIGFIDGAIDSAMFNNPQGIMLTPQNTIFVADMDNGALREVYDSAFVVICEFDSTSLIATFSKSS